MSTDFERLNIILAARDREFARAMDRNIRRIERFENKGKASLSRTSRNFDVMAMAAKRVLPALAALASVGALQQVVSSLDNIGKTADRLGLTTDALQELRAVAESSGVSTNTLDMAMQRFGRRLAEARQGTGEAKGALAEMGIELVNADGSARSMETVLDDVADKMSGMADQTDRNRIAMKLFDSEGVAMVNLLRNGADGMAEMRQEARDLGIVIDERLIRGAEDAQTKLDLMGRVIRANLSAALIELAPVLVSAARGVAALAQGLAGAIDMVRQFLDPQSDLEVAVSNVVLALNDEILASQALSRELASSTNMSVDAARQKLEEARSRHENAKAAIAEARAIALQSDSLANINERIAGAQEAVGALGFPSRDIAVGSREEQFEAAQQRLVELLNEQKRLVRVDEELSAQERRTAENVRILTEALEGATGGYVKLGGAVVETIELGDRLDASTARVGGGMVETAAQSENLDEAMRRLNELYQSGAIDGDQYAVMLAKLKGGLDDAGDAARNMNKEFAQTVSDVLRGTTSMGDALSRLGDQLLDKGLTSLFENLLGGTGIGNFFGSLFGSANGNAFSGGGLVPFANGGVVGSPTVFPMNGGRTGLMGEAGPEAIMPLTRMSNGKLGVQSSGGGGGGVTTIRLIAPEGFTAQQEGRVQGIAVEIVSQGLSAYDRTTLPKSVERINKDPLRIG